MLANEDHAVVLTWHRFTRDGASGLPPRDSAPQLSGVVRRTAFGQSVGERPIQSATRMLLPATHLFAVVPGGLVRAARTLVARLDWR